MLNLDPAKLLVIAVVAVILLGPDRLPHVARQVGAAWRTFSGFRHQIEAQVRDSMPDLPSSAEIARLARSPSALLDHLSTMGSDGDPSPLDTEPARTDPVADTTPRDPAVLRPRAPSSEPALPGDPGMN